MSATVSVAPSIALNLLRANALMVTVLAIVQGVLAGVFMEHGGRALHLHSVLSLVTFAVSIVAAIAAGVAQRGAENKLLLWLSLAVVIVTFAEVAFAEMAVVAAHVTLGFVLIAASATLFVLALRRPVSN